MAEVFVMRPRVGGGSQMVMCKQLISLPSVKTELGVFL